MLLKALQSKHTLCDTETFARYGALYKGGGAFRSMVRSFLPQQPQETNEVYALRCKESSFKPYIGQIVRSFAGSLFSAPYAVRAKQGNDDVTPEDFYSQFKEDCDGQGTDLTTFFKDRFRNALVNCASFWLVKMPSAPLEEGQGSLTRADWIARGLDRATIHPIETADVHDWEVGDDGSFLWVKVHTCSITKPDPASEAVVVDEWRIYFRDHVDVYRLERKRAKKINKDTDVPLAEQYDHGFTSVPVLSMRLPDGMWLLDAAADAQIEHFRLSSAQGWTLRRCAYPIVVFNLAARDEDPPVIARAFAVTIGKDDKLSFVEPSGASLDAMNKAIDSEKNEIYRIAQQMSMSADSSAGALGRSGLSKIQDAEAGNACLRDYAFYARAAIEATFEFVSNSRDDHALNFSIEGLDSFHAGDLGEVIECTTKAGELGLDDESPTFKLESHCRVAKLALPADTRQDTHDTIRKEIAESIKNGASRTKAAPVTPADGSEVEHGAP